MCIKTVLISANVMPLKPEWSTGKNVQLKNFHAEFISLRNSMEMLDLKPVIASVGGQWGWRGIHFVWAELLDNGA